MHELCIRARAEGALTDRNDVKFGVIVAVANRARLGERRLSGEGDVGLIGERAGNWRRSVSRVSIADSVNVASPVKVTRV